ncbi:Hypothetical protein PENO1_050840 [Penicillium occitanis (nom. inval.)]|nr:Hypothetical protein PENO1_050840 [Penicillium occitanis (nom. inval.)]PCH00677.1 hypothetical protein PENOC_051740 [Penicillium occitanis (nom. inval.)]
MLHSRVRPLPRSAEKSTGTNDKGSTAQAPGLFGTHEDENKENDEDAEDIFAAFLPHLLPDDAPQFHGDPGQLLRYDSPLYGPLTIMVPHYPGKSEENKRTGAELSRDNQPTNEVDEGRKLFAHFLWSSAMVVAQGVEDADAIEKKSGSKSIDRTMWNVKGHRVLELGAGTGLPSIISVLASASHVTITDHPSSPAFLGAIEHNIIKNVPASLRPNIDSAPHEWGVLENDEFAQKNKGGFTRIIAADCLWMLHQHENLARTLLWFLSDGKGNDIKEGRAWVVAGFHTGRAIVANFFETAVAMGLEIESIYERDLNAGEEEAAKAEQGEVRRAWEPVRVGEGPENRRRWCVIAILKRAKS